MNKLNLLKQAFQLEESTAIDISRDGLIDAICKMDLDTINLILEDDVSYQNTTKTIFLEKLKHQFLKLKNEDTHLVPYEGNCCAEASVCDNSNKKGVLFMGNNTGKYFNLIIEENKESGISDVYNCDTFSTVNKNINKQAQELYIIIYIDEKVGFKPNPDYNYFNSKFLDAINLVKQNSHTLIDKEVILDWYNIFLQVDEACDYPPFLYRNQVEFDSIYSSILKMYEFLMQEDSASKALKAFEQVDTNNETQLLKWLINYEELHFSLISLHPNTVSTEAIKSGEIELHKDLNVYLKTDVLQNCINAEAIYDTYYYDKLTKYSTTPKDQLETQSSLDDDYMKTASLKYHLEKRGFTQANKYKISNKNTWLNPKDNFGKLEKGKV